MFDDDALADDRLESGQLELHRIGADRNQCGNRKLPVSLLVADLRLDQHRAGQGDRCSRQHRAGVVAYSASDFTRLDLRQSRNRTHQQGQDGQYGGNTHFHLQPPLENEQTESSDLNRAAVCTKRSGTGRRPVVGLPKCLEMVVK